MKNSIRQQVFRLIDKLPDISLKDLYLEFKDSPKKTIKTYLTQHRTIQKNISQCRQIDIRIELIKIIKDYKTPASARVQAIREYNNMKESSPIEGVDPLVELLQTLEKDSSDNQK